MGIVRLIASVLALSSTIAAEGLADAMRAKGRSFIGTALTLRDDSREEAIISNKNDFNSITPENAMKWNNIEKTRGNPNWDDADRHVNWATSRGYQVFCHNLIYHPALPDWVANGKWTKSELIQIMKEHINTMVRRYKGKCTRWEVLNEALEDDGSYRKTLFYKVIGEEYIPLAFSFAHAADPHVALWYNEYNLELKPKKLQAARRLVKLVQNHHGARISGVGVQGHLASETTPTSERAASLATLEHIFSELTSLDIDVAYTEADVRMNVPSNAKKERVQAGVYNRMAKACLHNNRCIGITFWGVVDKHSWIADRWRGEGSACIWDSNYNKKRAYRGVLNGIQNP